ALATQERRRTGEAQRETINRGVPTRRSPWSFLLAGSLQERSDIRPELAAGLLFGLGQLDEGCLITQASQVGVILPVLEHFHHRGEILGLALFYQLGPQRQVGPKPIHCLLAQTGTLLVVEFPGILALAS